MTELSPLEAAALRAIAAQYPGLGEALGAQIAQARVVSRENSGAGFYTILAVGDAPALPAAAGCGPLGRVGADIVGLQHGMGFMLWLQDGRLYELEAYTYDDATSGLELERLEFGDVQPLD